MSQKGGAFKQDDGSGITGQALPGQDALDDDSIDLGVLLATLWGGRYLIATCMAAGLLVAAFQVASTPPRYAAAGLIQLEDRSMQLALPGTLGSLRESPRISTEREVLRSRLVLGRAVAAMNYDWRADAVLMPGVGQILMRFDLPLPEIEPLSRFARAGTEIELDLLEVPPDWLGRSMELRKAAQNRYTLTLPDERVVEGTVGETLIDDEIGFALRVARLEGPEGRKFRLRQETELAAVNRMRGGIGITERSSGSGIIEISFTAPSEAEALRAVDAIASAYIAQNVDRSAAELERSIGFIEAQLESVEAQVDEAADALDRFREERGAIDLDFATQGLLNQISTIDGELRRLESEEERVTERVTRNHPAYRELVRDRERLEARRAELQREVESLPEVQREALNLTRELRLAEGAYATFRERLQDLRVLRAGAVGDTRIIETAEPAPVRGRQPASRVLFLYGVLAALLGGGIVLLREYLRRTVQGPEQIEAEGLPVFSTVNYTPAADEVHRRRGQVPLLAVVSPGDLAVEGLRSLRTSLHFGMLDSASRSLAVTSAAAYEGKSFTAANLAVVTAQAGQTVCVVDSDLRRGRLRRYFGVPREALGLTDYLAEDATLEEILRPTEVPGLWFIPSGRLPPNPSELLMRGQLAQLVGELDGRLDLSIFDCPPVLPVTDPLIIARAVGACIAVFRHDRTHVEEVRELAKAFRSAGRPLAGAVLNGFDPSKTKAGYAYRYRYNYTYRYRYADTGPGEGR